MTRKKIRGISNIIVYDDISDWTLIPTKCPFEYEYCERYSKKTCKYLEGDFKRGFKCSFPNSIQFIFK